MFEFIASNWGWFAFGAYLLFTVCMLVLVGSNTREEIEMYGARVEDLPPDTDLEALFALRHANSKRIPADD
jgi:uroporphyrinogen-III synthase